MFSACGSLTEVARDPPVPFLVLFRYVLNGQISRHSIFEKNLNRKGQMNKYAWFGGNIESKHPISNPRKQPWANLKNSKVKSSKKTCKKIQHVVFPRYWENSTGITYCNSDPDDILKLAGEPKNDPSVTLTRTFVILGLEFRLHISGFYFKFYI